MSSTLWWTITGNGGPITLSSKGSTFDTVLAVYDPNLVVCSDDLDAGDTNLDPSDDEDSELVFNSVSGATYSIQLGGCSGNAGCGAGQGNVRLAASGSPQNDNRSSAQTVSTGSGVPANNRGATVESREVTTCDGASYGKSVWFRWVAPATGDVAFAADATSPQDTVLAAYLGDSATPLGCSDDAIGSGTSSRVQRRVEAGQVYLIQVGGFGAEQAAKDGGFSFGVEFTRDFDLDDDNSSPPAYCNDRNPRINPKATDVTNGIDDNCDGIVDPDRDGDGFARAPGGRDCNDGARNVNPSAAEVPGNLVDENCDGKLAAFPRIKAVLSLRGLAGDVFTVRAFVVLNVPRGARVRVRCRTPRGGSCGTVSRRALAASAGGRAHARAAKTVRIRLHRTFRPGSVITARVSHPSYIGFYQRLKIRRGTRPKRSRARCMNPGSLTPRRTCPGTR